jgi:hypothetical protein
MIMLRSRGLALVVYTFFKESVLSYSGDRLYLLRIVYIGLGWPWCPIEATAVAIE